MIKIVTLTMNPTVDVNVSVDRVVSDQKLRCSKPAREPGGGGINVSRAIGRLNGDSLALYPAGGAVGGELEELLDEEGLRHRRVPAQGLTRESFMVIEESTGQQYRFILPGPELKESEWKKCLHVLTEIARDADYIICSGSLPPGVPDDFYGQVAKLGKDLAARVIVDTKGEPLRQAAQAGVYLLKPNMRELSELSHRPLEDELDVRKAASQLVQSGQSEAVILSLGKGGAILLTRDVFEHIPSPTVPIKSTIGSGDSMVAAIVLALAEGQSLKEAAVYGVAAGAAAVMTPGTELCRMEDVERLHGQMTTAETPQLTRS